MGVLGVRACVEGVVERKEVAAGEQGGEMGGVGWHDELDVGAGFVEEVSQDGAGDYVCGCRAAAADRGFDEVHGAVGFEVGDDCVAHLA